MSKTYLPRFIDGDSYFRADAVNQTLLKQVLKSPAHAREYLMNPISPTPAMALGTAVHTQLLEPHLVGETIAVMPDINRRTKDGKEAYNKFLAKSANKTVITQEQAAKCLQINSKIVTHKTAHEILNTELYGREVSIGFEDRSTKLQCKARLDLVDFQNKSVVDIKTTADASLDGFKRSCAKFLYHLQAAFYIRAASGLDAMTAHEDGWRFKIIAIETVAPHGIAVYEFDQRALAEGNKLVDNALYAWNTAKIFDEYMDYPDEVQTISLPGWALTEEVSV